MSVVLTASDNADRAPEGLERQPALLHRHLVAVSGPRPGRGGEKSERHSLFTLYLSPSPLQQFIHQWSPPYPDHTERNDCISGN